jgi:hypothetical protein
MSAERLKFQTNRYANGIVFLDRFGKRKMVITFLLFFKSVRHAPLADILE